MNTNKQKKIKYDLSKLNNNYNELNNKTIDNINVCIYNIIKSDNITSVVAPFLCFLLYKYDDNIKNLSEYFVFPFKKYKKAQNKKAIELADDLVYNCTNNKLKSKGYIYENKNVYFFYESLEKHKLKVINRKNKLWWVVLDEICNHTK